MASKTPFSCNQYNCLHIHTFVESYESTLVVRQQLNTKVKTPNWETPGQHINSTTVAWLKNLQILHRDTCAMNHLDSAHTVARCALPLSKTQNQVPLPMGEYQPGGHKTGTQKRYWKRTSEVGHEVDPHSERHAACVARVFQCKLVIICSGASRLYIPRQRAVENLVRRLHVRLVDFAGRSFRASSMLKTKPNFCTTRNRGECFGDRCDH